MKVPEDEAAHYFGTGPFTDEREPSGSEREAKDRRPARVRSEHPREASIHSVTLSALSLGVLCAIGVFAFFVAARPDSSDPIQHLALASALCAAPAAALTFLWPAFPRVWGLLVSSCFWVFLLVVFVSFPLNGQLVWWPLIEAAVVITAGLCGARIGLFARRRYARRSTPRAEPRS